MYFSGFLRLKSPRSRYLHDCVLEQTLFLVHGSACLLRPHTVEGTRGHCEASFRRALIPLMRTPPSYFNPKPHLLNHCLWGRARISTCELEGEGNIPSMAWPIQSTLSGQMRKLHSSPGRLPAPCPTCALDVWLVEEGGLLLPGPHSYLLAGVTS